MQVLFLARRKIRVLMNCKAFLKKKQFWLCILFANNAHIESFFEISAYTVQTCTGITERHGDI